MHLHRRMPKERLNNVPDLFEKKVKQNTIWTARAKRILHRDFYLDIYTI